MQSLNIAIIGSRGIPNYYGGFEQMAQYLAVGLLQKGHQVTVYNSHTHPFQGGEWHGVRIIHCYDAENSIGTAGQFVYDFNCIMNARKKKYDVILFLGYTSSSVWGPLFPKNAVIISNMDGMEWKRDKYSKPVQNQNPLTIVAAQVDPRKSRFDFLSSNEPVQNILISHYFLFGTASNFCSNTVEPRT